MTAMLCSEVFDLLKYESPTFNLKLGLFLINISVLYYYVHDATLYLAIHIICFAIFQAKTTQLHINHFRNVRIDCRHN